MDSGPGIPEDQKQNSLASFFQLPGPERNRYRRPGARPGYCRQASRTSHHQIDLASTVGRGFAIRNPGSDGR